MIPLADVPTSILALGATGLLCIVTAVTMIVLRHRRERATLRFYPNNAPGFEGQYEVRTPAGRAAVTPVWSDDRGQRYEIEVYFDGMRDPVLYYVAPSMKVVERKLLALVDEWQTRRAAAAAEPRTPSKRKR